MSILDICLLFVCSFLGLPRTITSCLWFCELKSQSFALPDPKSLGIGMQPKYTNWMLSPGTFNQEWERHRSQAGLALISVTVSWHPVSRGRGGSNIDGIRFILTDPSHDIILAVILGFLKLLDWPVFWILILQPSYSYSSYCELSNSLSSSPTRIECGALFSNCLSQHIEAYEINIVGLSKYFKRNTIE